ncbi:MAG: ferredoxin reductase [Pseudomonadales bacterium]|nr:ferredoxin reductase [Pseudomonadales bacterium]
MDSSNRQSGSVSKWVNSALFNTESARDYFEAFVEGIDPMWSLKHVKARIEKVQKETADTLTLTLSPTQRFQGFKAGQHLQISFDINGVTKTRTFSISSTPSELTRCNQLQVTIKAIENGDVTPWIHQHLAVGTVVKLSQAQGEFLIPEQFKHLLYIAGGSGITPIMSHLRSLINNGCPQAITVLYYAKTSSDFIFHNELSVIAKRFKNINVYFVETQGAKHRDKSNQKRLEGHINEQHLGRALETDPDHCFICGPHALKVDAEKLVTEFCKEPPRFHLEHFGLPITINESSDSHNQQAFPVVLNRSQQQMDCDQSTTLLEAAEKQGLKPNHGCRMGICYTCKCKKQSGVVRNLVTGKLSSTEAEDIQLCVSVPATAVELDL